MTWIFAPPTVSGLSTVDRPATAFLAFCAGVNQRRPW